MGQEILAGPPELRIDRGFAVEYLKSALEELDNPEHRAVGLLALRDVAETCDGDSFA